VVARYGISIALVSIALAVTAVVFLFARPQYERYPNGGSEMIDFSEPSTSARPRFATPLPPRASSCGSRRPSTASSRSATRRSG
jgi:hypothetical protein